jgi:hypothetical protein
LSARPARVAKTRRKEHNSLAPMFCARCGQQIPDASEICPLCGQQTTLKFEPVAATTPAKSAPYDFVAIPQDLGPKGVGGWLLLYCLSLTFLGPILVIAPFFFFSFSRLHPGLVFRSLIRDSYYMIEVTRVLYGVVVGIALWMGRAIALQLLKIYFVFLAVDTLLSFLRLASIMLKVHATPFGYCSFIRSCYQQHFPFCGFCTSTNQRGSGIPMELTSKLCSARDVESKSRDGRIVAVGIPRSARDCG